NAKSEMCGKPRKHSEGDRGREVRCSGVSGDGRAAVLSDNVAAEPRDDTSDVESNLGIIGSLRIESHEPGMDCFELVEKPVDVANPGKGTGIGRGEPEIEPAIVVPFTEHSNHVRSQHFPDFRDFLLPSSF